MALYQLNISYDGTEYHGYQRQPRVRTIQGEIESALKAIGWRDNSIQSSGRTDTGVHADEQIASINLDWSHGEMQLKSAINTHLPRDIVVKSVHKILDKKFHPRYDAKSRIYRYQIYVSDTRRPKLDRYNWRVWPEVNLAKLHSVSKIIIGKHDFINFGRPYKPGGRTERLVIDTEWNNYEFDTDRYDFRITANSFLYHMVRRVVFILIRVAQGKVMEADVTDGIIKGIDNLPPGIAPAKGLFLEKINY